MQPKFVWDHVQPPELRKWMLNSKNSTSPYYGFIGNEKAVKKLIRVDFTALGNNYHVCAKMNLAFFGPPGVGKTDLVHRHMSANGLPSVEIHPRSVSTVTDMFNLIEAGCEAQGVPLEPANGFELPPMNIFIDEVHSLVKNIEQALLKPTEKNDGMLVTDKGVIINCRNVHWIIGSTDRGMLFDAFDTRFSKIELSYYTKDEIAQIVQTKYKKWPKEATHLAAHYRSKNPRAALDFAEEMQLEMNMNGGNWHEVAKQVADENNIDFFGMDLKCLNVLKILKNQPVAAKRLPMLVGIKEEELEKFVMPYLSEATADQPVLVGVSNAGYCITEAGQQELKKRSL